MIVALVFTRVLLWDLYWRQSLSRAPARVCVFAWTAGGYLVCCNTFYMLLVGVHLAWAWAKLHAQGLSGIDRPCVILLI